MKGAAMGLAAIRTEIPARLDRLPWSRWHWLVVTALGITWVLDGLEVTLVGAIGGVLTDPDSLGFSNKEVGLLGTSYLAGAILGALIFGYLTDRYGRRKLFFVTLALYLVSAGLTAFSWTFWSFACFRVLTGAGIGGEYAAVNSAVDELIPARVRGQADLAINGTFWLGAAAGSLATLVILDPKWFHVDIGWRFGFGIGAVLGLVILFFRRWIPESPRWLLTHGHEAEAKAIVADIEAQVSQSVGTLPPITGEAITIHPRKSVGFGLIARTMFRTYWKRSILGLALIGAQAYLYNATFFTYPLVLKDFYGVPGSQTGIYLLPFALGNFLGPLVLGRFFDTIGRRPMIGATYATSALLLAATGWLFWMDWINAIGQTALWSVIFFVASAAASSAYLTVSEVFPAQLRAMAIAFFYALGTAIGGLLTPGIFGALIDTGSRGVVFAGYLSVSAALLIAVVAVAAFGVKAERASLESVAAPLGADD
jgi:MFS family permease